MVQPGVKAPASLHAAAEPTPEGRQQSRCGATAELKPQVGGSSPPGRASPESVAPAQRHPLPRGDVSFPVRAVLGRFTGLGRPARAAVAAGTRFEQTVVMRSALGANPRSVGRVWPAFAAALVAASLGGCAAPAGRAEPAARGGAGAEGYQPGSWDVVLSSPEASMADAPWDEMWAMSRRDAELGAREARLATAAEEWDRPARPSLARPRYLFLPRRETTVLHFEPERGHRRDRGERRRR